MDKLIELLNKLRSEGFETKCISEENTCGNGYVDFWELKKDGRIIEVIFYVFKEECEFSMYVESDCTRIKEHIEFIKNLLGK